MGIEGLQAKKKILSILIYVVASSFFFSNCGVFQLLLLFVLQALA